MATGTLENTQMSSMETPGHKDSEQGQKQRRKAEESSGDVEMTEVVIDPIDAQKTRGQIRSDYFRDFTRAARIGKPDSDATYLLMKQQILGELRGDLGRMAMGRAPGSSSKVDRLAKWIGIVSALIFILVIGMQFLEKKGPRGVQGESERFDKDFSKLKEEELAPFFDEYRRQLPFDCKCDSYKGLDDQFNALIVTALQVHFREEDQLPIAVEKSRKNLQLSGEPGTGKSLFARTLFYLVARNIKAGMLMRKHGVTTVEPLLKNPKIAKELEEFNDVAEFYEIRCDSFFDKYHGNTEARFKQFLRFVEWRQRKLPVFVLIDEAERLLPRRGEVNVQGPAKNLVGSFLADLDGTSTNSHARQFFITATNFPSMIDGGFYRRFGSRLGIPLPKAGTIRVHMKEIFTPIVECLDEGQWKALAEACEGVLSLAEIDTCHNAIAQCCVGKKKEPYEGLKAKIEDACIRKKERNKQDQKDKKNPAIVDEMVKITDLVTNLYFDKETADRRYIPFLKEEIQKESEKEKKRRKKLAKKEASAPKKSERDFLPNLLYKGLKWCNEKWVNSKIDS